MVGLALFFGSLPGPWLTLAFPTAVSFAIHDRRLLARMAGAAAVVLIGAVMTTTVIGGVLLVSAVLAQASTTWMALQGRRLTMARTALPAIAGAGVGLALGAILAPDAFQAWEAELQKSVVRGGEEVIRRYRALGLDAATLETLDRTTDFTAALLVGLWPALAALALWLGAWLGYRLLSRWARIVPRLRRQLGRHSFERFRLGESSIWPVIAALAAFWLPSEAIARAASNVLLVGAVLYGIQGLAVGVWWMKRWEVSVATRVLVYASLLIFLSPVLLAGVVLLGLAEHWLVLRDRAPARPVTR